MKEEKTEVEDKGNAERRRRRRRMGRDMAEEEKRKGWRKEEKV